jgi:hypothetical protein
MNLLVEESPEPLAGVLRMASNEMQLGAPLDRALGKLSEQIPLVDVRFFVSAVLMQQSSGGNLAEILNKLAFVVRERFRLSGEVKATSAHGRLTSMVLIALPVVLTVALLVMDPIAGRLAEARKFLVDRRCPDHGWNHGGLYQSGEIPMSYPETTGIALLALAGSKAGELEMSLRCAERHAADPKSGEGANWLRLGLAAHGRKGVPGSGQYRDWTVNQMALRMLAEAGEAGRNPFAGHV